MNLETLEYPPLTEDIEEAKNHLDKYGMALIANVLSEDEVDEMDKRLNEQFLGEEKHKVGSKVRGDEGLGVQSADEEKVSRLVWKVGLLRLRVERAQESRPPRLFWHRNY